MRDRFKRAGISKIAPVPRRSSLAGAVWIPGFGKRPDGLYVAPSLDWVPVGSWGEYANAVRTPGYRRLGVPARLTLRHANLPIGLLPHAISVYLRRASGVTPGRGLGQSMLRRGAVSP